MNMSLWTPVIAGEQSKLLESAQYFVIPFVAFLRCAGPMPSPETSAR
jgi:hypothetical protein